ncbi:MAG: hypothetical protein GFH27_549293n320 [Chloroflexi bacterium AL-W]|nr:hypothetical protein [Chloroflexi bacterium AL-N1]NOK67565.1 hypothetical protein [Chloroflexi bacterium AL-N10]NOK75665.1 hypothetical protein [Chloroflexi bacterium AL-N5]NOK82453.1 hypothetical protein [Chloroflexi bacterium AL-W]NOK90298.1 hypothetical protein [Chloroflexi bacterium AL-N15]
MNWFSLARISVMLTLVIGIYLHLSRLIFGIELTHERLLTTTFDSVFAFVILFPSIALFMARNKVLIRNTVERVLFYFTLIYFSLSVVLHARTWFVPDNPQMLQVFPEWYSLFSLLLTSLLITGWWNLRPKPQGDGA